MAVTHKVGFNGSVNIEAATPTTLAVVSWELTMEADQLETTNMIENPGAAGSKAFYGGLKSWSGTIECAGDNNGASPLLVAGSVYEIDLLDGTSTVLDGRPIASGGKGHSLVTSVRTTVNTAEMIGFSADIVGPVTLSLE